MVISNYFKRRLFACNLNQHTRSQRPGNLKSSNTSSHFRAAIFSCAIFLLLAEQSLPWVPEGFFSRVSGSAGPEWPLEYGARLHAVQANTIQVSFIISFQLAVRDQRIKDAENRIETEVSYSQ